MVQEPPSDSDEELACQTQAGSLVAFEQLVYRYEDRVHAFVFQFCRNATDARELTQDTFVKAFQKIGQFDVRRPFAAWLFTIARRKCIDRHRAAPPLATDDSLPDQPDGADPSELIARREEEQNLWHIARARLDKNQFQSLWLHYVEDMDVARIAQVMGKTRVHVRVILFRARQVLGRELHPGPTLSLAVSTTDSRSMLTPFASQPATLPPVKS